MRLPGFDYRHIQVGDVAITTAVAGSGPPLLLLHGYPQTHLMWRHVAPALAEHHTVVATDLRGYGDSDKPAPDDVGFAYAKRTMAADQVAVMQSLGFARFDVVAHDRGARVAHRLTLDWPHVVARLSVLDIVPTRHVFAHADQAMATAYFHWFFLATRGGIPERLIGLDPEFWLRSMIDRLLAPGAVIEPEVMREYLRCFSEPAAIAGSCADYRSAATIDLEHDEHDAAAGRTITCPTLVLWGEHGFVGRNYSVLEVWRDYADDVTGRALPTGHFVPEEDPDAVLEEIARFLQ